MSSSASGRSERRAREAAAREVETICRRVGWARRLWHLAEPDVRGTLAARYLAGHGIYLERWPRAPRALRFHPACQHREIYQEMCEILDRKLPAMLAADAHAGRTVRVWRAPEGKINVSYLH